MVSYVYILKSSSGRFYVGSTDDMVRRVKQHELGHTQTTRNMKDFRLVFQQQYPSLLQARSVERKLKNLKRKDYLEKVVLDGYIKMQ